MKVGGHIAIAKREPIMGPRGASSGVQGQIVGYNINQLPASSHGKIAPFSLFCKLNTHRPTMHICCVSKNNYGNVCECDNVQNVSYCHSRQKVYKRHPLAGLSQACLLLRSESMQIWPAVREMHFVMFPYIRRSVTHAHHVETTSPMEFVYSIGALP